MNDKDAISLGVARSLYDDPQGKTRTYFVSANKLQKYETDDEIKYSIDLVLQKYNSNDQVGNWVNYNGNNKFLYVNLRSKFTFGVNWLRWYETLEFTK